MLSWVAGGRLERGSAAFPARKWRLCSREPPSRSHRKSRRKVLCRPFASAEASLLRWTPATFAVRKENRGQRLQTSQFPCHSSCGQSTEAAVLQAPARNRLRNRCRTRSQGKAGVYPSGLWVAPALPRGSGSEDRVVESGTESN